MDLQIKRKAFQCWHAGNREIAHQMLVGAGMEPRPAQDMLKPSHMARYGLTYGTQLSPGKFQQVQQWFKSTRAGVRYAGVNIFELGFDVRPYLLWLNCCEFYTMQPTSTVIMVRYSAVSDGTWTSSSRTEWATALAQGDGARATFIANKCGGEWPQSTWAQELALAGERPELWARFWEQSQTRDIYASEAFEPREFHKPHPKVADVIARIQEYFKLPKIGAAMLILMDKNLALTHDGLRVQPARYDLIADLGVQHTQSKYVH